MRMRDYTLVFGGGETLGIEAAGDFFRVLTADSEVKVYFDDQPAVTRQEGQAQRGEFRRIRIYSVAAQTVKIAAGYGDVTDNRQDVTVNVSTDLDPGTIINNIAKVSCPVGATTLVLAGNVDRRAFILQSAFANPPGDIVVIGGLGVGADDGLELYAGSTTPEIVNKAAVYVHNPAGNSGPVVIRVWEDEL